VTVRSLPFSSSTLRSSASAYLVPSWKMWPISMPRADSSPCPQDGRWHTLECRRAGSDLAVVVDGQRRGGTTIPADLTVRNRIPLDA